MSLLGGLAGVAGGLWTSKANQDFAEEMASTQYQRAVHDMKAAGLNPNAVFGSGGGTPAAAPGGQATNPGTGFGEEGLMSSASSLIGMRKDLADTDQTKALTGATEAKADEQRASARIAQSQAEVVERENTAYKKTLDTTAGKTLSSLGKLGLNPSVLLSGLTSAAKGIGSFFGGYSSARQARQDQAEAREAATLKHTRERELQERASDLRIFEQQQKDVRNLNRP